MLAGASEPLGWMPLVLIAVPGYFLVVGGLSTRRAMLVSLLFGAAYFYPLIVWMRAIGTDAWIALAGVSAAFFIPVGAVVAVAQRRNRFWPLWEGTLAWVAAETIRNSWPFSGFPWGRLSFTVLDTPWARGLPWYGFTGSACSWPEPVPRSPGGSCTGDAPDPKASAR